MNKPGFRLTLQQSHPRCCMHTCHHAHMLRRPQRRGAAMRILPPAHNKRTGTRPGKLRSPYRRPRWAFIVTFKTVLLFLSQT